MAIEKLNNQSEAIRFIRENAKKQEIDETQNPILQRCLEKSVDPQKSIHQAYDRMYHKHNRS